MAASAILGATERIQCGLTYPEPDAEARVQFLREQIGADLIGGCGAEMVWVFAYRCLECGRWFHASCMREHFRDTRHDKVSA